MGAQEIITQAQESGLDAELATRLQDSFLPAWNAFASAVPPVPPARGDDTELIAQFLDACRGCTADVLMALPQLAGTAADTLELAATHVEPTAPRSRKVAVEGLRDTVRMLVQLFESVATSDLERPAADQLEFPSRDDVEEMEGGIRHYFRVLMLLMVSLERVNGPLDEFAVWAWSTASEAKTLEPHVTKFVQTLRRPFAAAEGDFEQQARSLARRHRESDPQLTRVLMVAPDRGADEIRLLEVTGSVGTTNEIVPFTFAARPAEGLDFTMSVILVSDDEYQALVRGDLELPDDWGSVASLLELPYPDGE